MEHQLDGPDSYHGSVFIIMIRLPPSPNHDNSRTHDSFPRPRPAVGRGRRRANVTTGSSASPARRGSPVNRGEGEIDSGLARSARASIASRGRAYGERGEYAASVAGSAARSLDEHQGAKLSHSRT